MREALVLVVVLAAIVAAVVFVQQRPDGVEELKIPIEALRSQFAQLSLGSDEAWTFVLSVVEINQLQTAQSD